MGQSVIYKYGSLLIVSGIGLSVILGAFATLGAAMMGAKTSVGDNKYGFCGKKKQTSFLLDLFLFDIAIGY